MKVVKFVEAYPPYAPGDVAGVSDEVAKAAIEAKAAVAYAAKGAKEELVEEVSNVETASVDAPVVDKMVKSPNVKK